ncbi:hypothetical protein UlMin_032079 [Ulmus minor]
MSSTLGGGIKSCDDRCGCPSPCPGGVSCRCNRGEERSSGGGEEHMKCSCGDHCGCNPCKCADGAATGDSAGKAYCKCGDACTCATCAS